MSYQYSHSGLLTISNEKLNDIARNYGYQEGATYANIYQIAEKFNKSNQDSAIAEVEHSETGSPFLSITLTQRIPESEGTAGVKALAERYKGVVDSAEIVLTDEHGQSALAEL